MAPRRSRTHLGRLIILTVCPSIACAGTLTSQPFDFVKLSGVVCRIPLATCHPQLQGWVGGKPLLLVLNRIDMVSPADQAAWGVYFRRQQQPTFWTDAKLGTGVRKVAVCYQVVSFDDHGAKASWCHCMDCFQR